MGIDSWEDQVTLVEQLAQFVSRASYEAMSEAARLQIKLRILDALGCAIGAFFEPPVMKIRQHIEEFGGAPLSSLIGGGRTAPDRAAFYNSSLVRYLDFNDSYLAKGETCHPSDNFGAVLAASEYASGSGRDLMVSLAIAYQVQCRLSDVAPVRAKGFDHTTQGAYAVAAGVSKALRLDAERTANAIAISGTAFNALRVTRTGALSNWKGLAFPETAFGATQATFLAAKGITGPKEVFEGNKGFMDSITGKFAIDWEQEDLERVTRTILKKYNAEIHSQSAIEAVLELKREQGFTGRDVEHLDLETFDVAYNIIGGGEEGNKLTVQTKEEADHSLPYILAVALLDDQVMPPQYDPNRIRRPDVQDLLRRVSVKSLTEFSRLFPDQMPARITVTLKDGRRLEMEKQDYEGFITRPMSWNSVVHKFEQLCQGRVDDHVRDEIENTIFNLESFQVEDLTRLLGRVSVGSHS